MLWLLGASLISYALSGIVLIIAINLPFISVTPDSGPSFFVIYLLSTLPALYVIGRLSLIFPATAVDTKSSIRQSWNQTKGQGWKMVVVIGLYPWLISLLMWLVVQEDPSLASRMISALLYYIGLALEVTALSLTFRCFIPANEQSV